MNFKNTFNKSFFGRSFNKTMHNMYPLAPLFFYNTKTNPAKTRIDTEDSILRWYTLSEHHRILQVHHTNFVIFSKEYQLESKLKKRTMRVSINKLKDLPASSKLAYKILVHEGNMTQKELINVSLLPERTVRYALNILMKRQLITHQPHFSDARQTIYGV